MDNKKQKNFSNRFEELIDFYKTFDVELSEPKKDCKKCYGRGYIGLDSETDFPIMCKCIKFVSGEFDKNVKTPQLNRNFRRKFLTNKNKKGGKIDIDAIAEQIKNKKEKEGDE